MRSGDLLAYIIGCLWLDFAILLRQMKLRERIWMLKVQVGAGSPSSARDPGHTTYYQREFTKQIPPETSHAPKPIYNINTALGLFKNDN